MQIPASPDELTVEWLASVLEGQSRRPVSICWFDAEPLVGEQGMTGQLVRLRLRYEDERCGLPQTLIAKFSAAEATARAVISALGHYEREVRFYDLLSSRTPVPTPHCYYSHLDPDTGFAVLVLEDLARARNGNSIAGCTVDQVSRVLATLARMHAAWWQASDLADASWLRLRYLLAPEAMAGAFEQGWPLFLQKLSIPLTPQISDMADWIACNLSTAGTALFETGPRTLVHNDVQADNVFFGEGDEDVILLDWQMVTYGRCIIDVAGWIRGQLELKIRRTTEPQLLLLYHDALVANGVRDYSIEQCLADYRLATVLAPARLACAVGLSGGLKAHPGAFWDTLIRRYPD